MIAYLAGDRKPGEQSAATGTVAADTDAGLL